MNYEYPAQLTPKSKAFIDKILKKNPTERISIDEVLKDKFLQWYCYLKIKKSINHYHYRYEVDYNGSNNGSEKEFF